MNNDVAATTDVTTDVSSDVQASDVASSATDIVKATVIETPVMGYTTVVKHKAEFNLPIQSSARDIRNRLQVNDIVQFSITLTSGAKKTIVGIIKGVGTLKGNEFVEKCYNVAIFNTNALLEEGLEWHSGYERLKSFLCYRTNSEGEVIRDKAGKAMLVAIPVTPLAIMNVDSSYRTFLESLEDNKPVRTSRTATSNKSTNLSTLI